MTLLLALQVITLERALLSIPRHQECKLINLLLHILGLLVQLLKIHRVLNSGLSELIELNWGVFVEHLLTLTLGWRLFDHRPLGHLLYAVGQLLQIYGFGYLRSICWVDLTLFQLDDFQLILNWLNTSWKNVILLFFYFFYSCGLLIFKGLPVDLHTPLNHFDLLSQLVWRDIEEVSHIIEDCLVSRHVNWWLQRLKLFVAWFIMIDLFQSSIIQFQFSFEGIKLKLCAF